ncbi:MAG: beta galactosidase jelly roll domain-containing protein [Bryobacterales bacterium]|nr:beta galactosidase jelly roll domain-containing protein [Bryobacterales bacterium]
MDRTLLLSILLAAAAFGQDQPRPEHPQPQFQREQWLNLNGRWEFEFDDADAGLREGWAASDRKFSRSIAVPYAFETRLSGIGDTSFHPYIWYRRSFEVPAGWKDKRVLLRFGAVDYRATVWVNGRVAGEHEGGSVPFSFDITPLLRSGANSLVVRVEDQPTDRYQPRGKQYWEPKSRGIFYTRTSGIWQTVWLEAAGASHLSAVHIQPSNDGVVRFDARIVNPAPDLEFHASISWAKEVAASTMVRASSDRLSAAAQVGNPRLWSVESPNLYDVRFELRRGGTVVDRVDSYFGYRTVAIENGRVAINGRPVYLKMVLDQGYWPESALTPPSDEAIQYDIRMTKEMGFNGARKHQKLEDPRFLYWADRMGFLVSSEAANAYLFDEVYVARFAAEWAASVERDRNHPSVIMWIPINESWGVPDLRDPRQQNHLKSLYHLTHSLDGTRPVIDNDGWEHTDLTDLMGIHDYARSGDLLYEKYKILGSPGVRIPDGGRVAMIPGFQYNGSPIFLSEFGGIAYIPPGAAVPPESWGYSGVEKTPEAALERLRSLYEAIARIPAIIGICYTQITDVEQEVNGLMTYDRKPKFDSKVLRELNGLLR